MPWDHQRRRVKPEYTKSLKKVSWKNVGDIVTYTFLWYVFIRWYVFEFNFLGMFSCCLPPCGAIGEFRIAEEELSTLPARGTMTAVRGEMGNPSSSAENKRSYWKPPFWGRFRHWKLGSMLVFWGPFATLPATNKDASNLRQDIHSRSVRSGGFSPKELKAPIWHDVWNDELATKENSMSPMSHTQTKFILDFLRHFRYNHALSWWNHAPLSCIQSSTVMVSQPIPPTPFHMISGLLLMNPWFSPLNPLKKRPYETPIFFAGVGIGRVDPSSVDLRHVKPWNPSLQM